MAQIEIEAQQPRLAAAFSSAIVPVFTVTLFFSAFLLFSVQPYFTKIVLPKLGGSPGVWSVAMVFFQFTLLLGYGYAHVLIRYFSSRNSSLIHLAVMVIAFIALPIAIPLDGARLASFKASSQALREQLEMASEMTKEKFEDDFIDYAEKGHTVELLGQTEVDGVMTYELKLTKKDGTEEFHYFEPEYMVPIMQKTIVSEGQMKGQAVEVYMSDYEEHEGLMIPMYIESKMGGATQFSMTVTKVELNPELEETLFAYPKGK